MGDNDHFYQYVQIRASELRVQIDQLKTTKSDATIRDNAITKCLAEISDLTSEIRSQVDNAASHDQRTYNETLKGLNEQLQKVRSEIAPRRKFAFNSVPKSMPACTPLHASTAAPTSSSSNKSIEISLQADATELVNPGGTPSIPSFAHLDNTLSMVSDPRHVDGGVVLADSKCCIIKCSLPTRSLSVKDVHKSVIVAGPVNGAAHVMRLADSILVVSCRQLRMHDCRDCTVYLLCSSNPIIERCSEMRFSSLPDILGIVAPEATQTNLWSQVNDFNWLKAGHSPNWSIVSLENQLGADQWRNLQSLKEGDPVDTALKSFNIS